LKHCPGITPSEQIVPRNIDLVLLSVYRDRGPQERDSQNGKEEY